MSYKWVTSRSTFSVYLQPTPPLTSKAPIHFETKSGDPINHFGKLVEGTNEITHPLVSCSNWSDRGIESQKWIGALMSIISVQEFWLCSKSKYIINYFDFFFKTVMRAHDLGVSYITLTHCLSSMGTVLLDRGIFSPFTLSDAAATLKFR